MRRHLSLVIFAAVFSAAMITIFHKPSHANDVIERVAGPTGSPEGPYNQQLWWIPVLSSGELATKVLLETMVYSPPGSGPFPLVTINHGKPAPGTDLRSMRPDFETAAHWFVDRGFIVAVPLRQGYGRSEGAESDMVGTCATLDYLATSKQTARDIEGAIDYLVTNSMVDGNNV